MSYALQNGIIVGVHDYAWIVYMFCLWKKNLRIRFFTNKISEMARSAVELRERRRYVRGCFERIRRQDFVLDVLVFDITGVPLKSTMNRDETIRYTGLIEMLIDKSKLTIRKLNENDILEMIRIKTRKFEIIVTQDDQLYFMVFQNPVTKR